MTKRRIAALLSALCLTLALIACARVGDADAEDRFLLYYPAADLRPVAGGDAVVARETVIAGASALTTQELAERLLEALLDGAAGALTVDPTLAELEEFADRENAARERRERLAATAHLPAVTLSGRRIAMMANIGSPDEAAAAAEAGADELSVSPPYIAEIKEKIRSSV